MWLTIVVIFIAVQKSASGESTSVHAPTPSPTEAPQVPRREPPSHGENPAALPSPASPNTSASPAAEPGGPSVTSSSSMRTPTDATDGNNVKYVYVTSLRADVTRKDGTRNGTNIGEIFIPADTLGGITTLGSNTNVYIIGIVGVVPAAGAVLWCVRWFITRKDKKPQKTAKASCPSNKRPLPELVPRTFTKVHGPQEMTSSAGQQVTKAVDSALDLAGGRLEYRRSTWKKRPSPWELPRGRLRLLHILGEGNFGQVWKAEARQMCGLAGPVIVAVKTVKENATAKDKEDLLKELQIMQQLGPHPNVVTLLGCCTTQEPHYVVLEYVVRGKLLTYLRDHRSRRKYYNYGQGIPTLSSRDLTMFAYHVATGMEYISSKGILHRDLAARNILVDYNNICKVADFGLSKSVRDTDCQIYEQKTKGALPIRWMAPESLYMNVFTVKSDVWAFGILLWEIVTLGSTPYPGMGAREVIQFVREGHVMERPDHCRPELYRVMRTCWLVDPNERPSFPDLRTELARLLEVQTGYVDLEHFPEQRYYNLYQSPGEKV